MVTSKFALPAAGAHPVFWSGMEHTLFSLVPVSRVVESIFGTAHLLRSRFFNLESRQRVQRIGHIRFGVLRTYFEEGGLRDRMSHLDFDANETSSHWPRSGSQTVERAGPQPGWKARLNAFSIQKNSANLKGEIRCD